MRVSGAAAPTTNASQKPPSGAAWLLLAPLLAWLALFVVAPTLIMVVYSFCQRGTLGGVEFRFTLENYAAVLDPAYLWIIVRSVIYAGLATAICLGMGYPVAFVIGRAGERWRARLLLLIMIPFWTSFLIRTLAWRTLLADDGPIWRTLHWFRLIHGPLGVLDTQTSVMIGIVYGYLPLMTIPLVVALERVPATTGEASKDLGAGRFRTFFGVTLPQARPGIVAGLLLTFVPMTGEYVIPALLGGDKGVLLGNVIADQYLLGQNFPLGSAMAVLVLLVIGTVILIVVRTSRAFGEVQT